jgi:hypothetical protein
MIMHVPNLKHHNCNYSNKHHNRISVLTMFIFNRAICTLSILLLLFGASQAAQSIRSSSLERTKQKDDHDQDILLWDRLLEDISSFPPTRPPSPTPPSPTSPRPTPPPNGGEICGMPPELRAQLLTDMAQQISGTITPGTPQFQALSWLIGQDRYFVCPDDPKAYQRYILAVFYFSAEGDNWLECSAPENFDDPDSIAEANDNCSVTTTPIPGGDRNPAFLPTTEGADAWLTPVYECEWAGITCRVEGKCVDRIEFGKKS